MVWLLLFLPLIAAGLFIAYSRSSASGARTRARAAVAAVENLDREIRVLSQRIREDVAQAARNYVQEIRIDRLRAIHVDELRRHASGMRLQALKEAGLWSLADLQGWSADRLAQLRGVGPKSATSMAYVIATLTTQSNALPIPHPIPSEHGQKCSLVQAVCLYGWTQSWLTEKHQKLQATIQDFLARQKGVLGKTSFARWLPGFGSHADVQSGIVEAEALARELKGDSSAAQLYGDLSNILSTLKARRSDGIEWELVVKDYSENQNHYVSVLTEHLGVPGGAIATKTAVAVSEPVPVRTVARAPVKVVHIPAPPTAPLSARSSAGCWVPPGKDVTVKGFLIKGGMVYVGADIVSGSGYGVEPALINPTKPVSESAADCHTRYMSYWPSYDTITPEARASYLQWLAGGKCDPESDIGYVFLYFYGLERRALSDAGSDQQANAEIPLIEQEVRRLLGIYGKKGSFHGYANSFLEYLAAKRREGLALENRPVPSLDQGRGSSLDLRVGLGLHACGGKPLPAEWGFAWYSSTHLPRVVARCPDAFESLYTKEFVKRFGDGIKLPVNKTRIKVTHRAASAGFAGKSFTAELDLPDVSILSDPAMKVKEVGDVCCSLLASYGRLLIVNPDKANSLEALLLMPICLWPESVCAALRNLRRAVSEADQAKLIPLRELLAILPHGDDLNRARFSVLSRALGSFGLGIEPDVRFGSDLAGPDSTIALFVGNGLDQDSPFSNGFPSAALVLHMAYAVASADNSFGEAEATVILNHINCKSNLLEVERDRLLARLCLYRTSPPNCAGLKKRAELDKRDRETISDFLVRVALAGGMASPSKVRILESLFKLMGMDQSALYNMIHTAEAQLHSVSTEIDAPTPIRVPAPRTSGSSIQLDPTRLAALKADSDRVSALLESVFADTAVAEPEEPPIEDHDEKMEVSGLDLDADHAGLLQVLLRRVQWSRTELEEICADRGLMPDGAIERINEAAFIRYDSALIEGEDPVDVNCELMLEEAT